MGHVVDRKRLLQNQVGVPVALDPKRSRFRIEHGSPFTWTQGESLDELEKPPRVIQIVADFDRRKQRDQANRVVNPLRPIENTEDIDEIYGEDEGNGACAICHK